MADKIATLTLKVKLDTTEAKQQMAELFATKIIDQSRSADLTPDEAERIIGAVKSGTLVGASPMSSTDLPASDLSANHIGLRVAVTTLTGVALEDVLTEVRFMSPRPYGGAVVSAADQEPQVWARFKHAAPSSGANLDFTDGGGFFLSPTSRAIVTNRPA